VKYAFFVTVNLTALVFAILGPLLSEDLSTVAFEMALNMGQDATLLDHGAVVLLLILITPFVFVLDFSSPPRILFALNGACWACACWGAWKAWHGIRRKLRERHQSR